MVIISGVDEAGRGPVLGPMIMATCSIKEEDEYLLKELGVADSKKIPLKKRNELFDKIILLCKYSIEIVSHHEIDDALNNPDMNLNKLEAITTTKLLNTIKADKVYVDLPTKDAALYISEIKKGMNFDCEIIAEHKADDNYAICSAASILAKVTRDREIEKIKKKIGIDIGSGYPSDPKTKEFIKKYYDKYDVFRKTWQTYKNVIEAKKQKNLFDY